jgi:predicted membrane channel-forming protein YqfA (hemolysin III family)
MYIVAIAWAFVVLLMTLTEATSTQGTILGALFTFFGYGVLPLGIVLYVMGAPMRRRARLQAEQMERDAWLAQQAQLGQAAASMPQPSRGQEMGGTPVIGAKGSAPSGPTADPVPPGGTDAAR